MSSWQKSNSWHVTATVLREDPVARSPDGVKRIFVGPEKGMCVVVHQRQDGGGGHIVLPPPEQARGIG